MQEIRLHCNRNAPYISRVILGLAVPCACGLSMDSKVFVFVNFFYDFDRACDTMICFYTVDRFLNWRILNESHVHFQSIHLIVV